MALNITLQKGWKILELTTAKISDLAEFTIDLGLL